MESFNSMTILRAAAIVLSIPVVTSCVHGAAIKEVSNALYLSNDGRVAWLAPKAFPEGIESLLSGAGKITLVHEASGIKLTCPLSLEKERYYFSNYGSLLRKGDRVAVLFDGPFSARVTIE